MAVSKTQDITVITGEYVKDGQTKKRYLTIGTLFTYDDGGTSIIMDAIPVGWDGRASVYDRRPREQQQQPQQGYQQQQPQQGYGANAPVYQEQYRG